MTDGHIRLHPAHWEALYELQHLALVWDYLVGHNGEKNEETQRYFIAMRRAIERLRIVTALLEIPESLMLINREELLRRCGLRTLSGK